MDISHRWNNYIIDFQCDDYVFRNHLHAFGQDFFQLFHKIVDLHLQIHRGICMVGLCGAVVDSFAVSFVFKKGTPFKQDLALDLVGLGGGGFLCQRTPSVDFPHP